MKKNMPDVTPTSESGGLPMWLLTVFIVTGMIIFILTARHTSSDFLSHSTACKAPLVALCMYWINTDYWSL